MALEMEAACHVCFQFEQTVRCAVIKSDGTNCCIVTILYNEGANKLPFLTNFHENSCIYIYMSLHVCAYISTNKCISVCTHSSYCFYSPNMHVLNRVINQKQKFSLLFSVN